MTGTGVVVPTPKALIAGRRVDAAGGETIDARNPATGQLLARIPRCVAADVDAAVSGAVAAASAWRTTDIASRAALVLALADRVDARRDELVALDVADNGTPIRVMVKDAELAATALRYFAGLALQLRGETIPTTFDRIDFTVREPFGVVARILPFNHPLLYAAGRLAAPLLAGNAVILKPSEHTSLSALALADDFEQLFPAGVVSVVTGYGAEAGDRLVAHPDVPRVAFTGGVETGRRIQARAASEAVKTVTLELGGKNPIVVFPDADLDRAVDGVVAGMNFTWQGQSCGSTSRLIVHRDLHDAFVDRLVERVEGLQLGQPADPATDIGALVNQAQMEKVLGYVEIARGDGAHLRCGGRRVITPELGDGFFVRPTIFTDVSPAARVATEEIFGPVLAVMTFDGYAQALEIANSVSLGLTASVYTRDLRTALAFARDVQSGYVWVNDSSSHIPGAPFGGVKDSGVGREEDLGELESYTQLKNVNIRFDEVIDP